MLQKSYKRKNKFLFDKFGARCHVEMMDQNRYAIYYLPDPTSNLWEKGSRWLGRDPCLDADIPSDLNLPHGLINHELLVKTPALYGFHATLKPPMYLGSKKRKDQLYTEVGTFADQSKPIPIPALKVKKLGNFLALVPGQQSLEITDFARSCVISFDKYRAEPSDLELERRRASGLSTRQNELLTQWGYPYVMEEFRFHLSLTGEIDSKCASVLQPFLSEYFKETEIANLQLDRIAILSQSDSKSPFILEEFFSLRGS